jgi:maltose/moltooligosaccharide transporter
MEPFRAFVGDKLASEQQTAGFAMQTFMIGCGAVIASLLPSMFDALGYSNVPVNGGIPETVRYAFYAGAAAYFTAVMWTVFTSDELPPENMEAFRAAQARQTVGGAVVEIFAGFGKMPATMVQLAVVQFFSWVALFAMWIYTTSGIAENVWHTTDAQSAGFQDAGNWVGTMFAVYNGVSALAAFLLPQLAKSVGRKLTHLICLVIGGVSLMSIYFISDKTMLLVPMIGVGIAWASILTMPYAILAGSLPSEKMGYYMGVFNFFIVIPQILSGLLLGFVTKNFFGGHTVMTLALGGASMALAGVLCLIVKDDAPKVSA